MLRNTCTPLNAIRKLSEYAPFEMQWRRPKGTFVMPGYLEDCMERKLVDVSN
jgi:hypothetical protein